MDFLIELLFDLLLEGSIEASKSNKVPKIIRYILIILIVIFFIAVIGIIFLTGILLIKENIVAGLFIIGIGIFMMISFIAKFIKMYLNKND